MKNQRLDGHGFSFDGLPEHIPNQVEVLSGLEVRTQKENLLPVTIEYVVRNALKMSAMGRILLDMVCAPHKKASSTSRTIFIDTYLLAHVTGKIFDVFIQSRCQFEQALAFIPLRQRQWKLFWIRVQK